VERGQLHFLPSLREAKRGVVDPLYSGNDRVSLPERIHCPRQFELHPDGSIEAIEKIIKFKLPEDYKYYLENFNEQEYFIGPECLRLWDLDNLLENNYGYNISDNLINTIGIGANMSSECIAIEYLGQNKYRVVLTPFIDLDAKYHIEIGASFTDMLIRLDNGKEWFS
jgi:hypothetical protein